METRCHHLKSIAPCLHLGASCFQLFIRRAELVAELIRTAGFCAPSSLISGSLKEIAAELGISYWNLRDWTKRHGRNQPVVAAMSPAQTQREMARLMRENESLRARCDVLKKACGRGGGRD